MLILVAIDRPTRIGWESVPPSSSFRGRAADIAAAPGHRNPRARHRVRVQHLAAPGTGDKHRHADEDARRHVAFWPQRSAAVTPGTDPSTCPGTHVDGTRAISCVCAATVVRLEPGHNVARTAPGQKVNRRKGTG